MTFSKYLRPKWIILLPLLILLLVAVACGADATPAPVIVEKEVPIEVIKEVLVTVEVPVEVIKEVPKEVIQEVPVTVEVVKEVVMEKVVTKVVLVVATPTAVPEPEPVGNQGGNANYEASGTPTEWDPHQAGNNNSIAGISPLYNQLVEFNPINPGQIIGDLAVSWDSNQDGTAYTFKLVENAKWSDGKAITAEDAAFSIMRMIDPDAARPRAGLLKGSTESAEVVDQYTVKINLSFPSASFLPFLAVDYMKIVPKHVIEADTDINVWKNIVAGGPYLPKDDNQEIGWVHEKNPNYFKRGKPYFDTLTMNYIKDPGTFSAAVEAGKIDVTGPILPISVAEGLALSKKISSSHSLFWTPGNSSLHMLANVNNKPFDDRRVVYAMRLATDQNQFRKIIGDEQYGLGAPFPPDSWYGHTTEELLQLPGYGGLPGSPRSKADDIALAKQVLKEAGYDPPSKLGKIVVQTAGIQWFGDALQLFAQQMRTNLGLDVEVDIVDIGTQIGAFISGEANLSYFGYAINIVDPDDMFGLYGTGGRNWTRWQDDEWLRLFDKQKRVTDVVKRAQILRDLENILLQGEDPYINLGWATYFHILDNKIRTEAGDFVPIHTNQTIMKMEHLWWGK